MVLHKYVLIDRSIGQLVGWSVGRLDHWLIDELICTS